MKSVSIDLPMDYFKREPLHVTGVSRVADNDKALLVSFAWKPTDDDLRKFHDHLRAFFGARQ